MIKHAFTLVELLVVISIMIILLAITLPAYITAQQKVHSFQCISNLHQIGQAVAMYRADNDDLCPIGAYNSRPPFNPHWDRSWHDLILPYLDNRPDNLYCPLVSRSLGYRFAYGCNPWISDYYSVHGPISSNSSHLVYAADKANFDWPARPRSQWDDLDHTYLKDRHLERVDVLFCDSHVRSVDPITLNDLTYWIPR